MTFAACERDVDARALVVVCMDIPPDQHPFFAAHEEAMDLAVRADEARRSGRADEAFDLYRAAVKREGDALRCVPADKPRTRHILTESVRALTLKSADAVRDAASAPNCMEWRGDYGGRGFSVSVQWADGQSPHALIDEARRERDAALAIIEGRTVAPNDHELEVHAARGGRWRTRYQVGDPALCRDGMEAPEAREVRERMRPLHVYTWWATEADGTPCPWPVTP